MVTVMLRPSVQLLRADEEQAVYELLSGSGGLTPEAVASVLRLDESDVAVYLANQAGLGHIQADEGRYTTWHWL